MDNDINKMLDDIEQKGKKKAPYPLETLDEDLSNLSFNIGGLKDKIQLANQNAVIKQDKKKKAITEKMLFKVNAILSISIALAKDFERLKF